jgi:hypothetical protein
MADGGRIRRSALWAPPLVLLGVGASSGVLYDIAAPAVANVVIYVYGFALIAGPSLLWPWLRLRGASTAQTAAACLVVPSAWILKECLAVGRVFSAGEAAYYAFNPLSLGLLAALVTQGAVCELLVRRVRSGRWRPFGRAGTVLLGAVATGAAYALVARVSGVTAAHYAYLEVYRWIFGG